MLESVKIMTKRQCAERSALDLRNSLLWHQNIGVGPATFIKQETNRKHAKIGLCEWGTGGRD